MILSVIRRWGKTVLFPPARTLVASFALTAMTACAVGPDFRRPEAPSTNRYTSGSLPEKTASSPGVGGEAQRFIFGREIPAKWWTLFHSEALDRLIRQALGENPTLAAAEAALRQAHENVRAQFGAALMPHIDADLSAERQKFSGAFFGQPNAKGSIFNLYNASVSVSYALDLFGGARRELESLQSRAEYQRFQLEGACLALTSNIVTAAVKEAMLRAQILTTREILSVLKEQLDLVERQYALGGVSYSDVLSQRTQLAQTRATLPPMEKALAQTRHQLAVLAGRLPGEASIPAFSIDEFHLPEELPVSLPSELVRQRPDIRASEALLHEANSQVGVATSNLYPQITLTGGYGTEATRVRDLFESNTFIWHMAAGLLQPVFHGGELSARRRAAVAAYDQAAANYQETVLLAFQDVADVLRALESDANALRAQVDSESAARDSLELAQKQFELGALSYLSLLNAQRQYQQAKIDLIQAQAIRLADTAALFQALGGGWWNRETQKDAGPVARKD